MEDAERKEVIFMLTRLWTCLGEHLEQQAEYKKVPVKELCPCMTHEMKQAKELIARLKRKG